MIYRPAKGGMWDPSIIWHDGAYHAFMMYNQDGPNGLDGQHCLWACSADGVHWHDEAAVIAEREPETGNKFFKCFVGRCGDHFILDHGVQRREGQDTLRFYESTDLRHWTYLASTHPDPRWYVPAGRWDHMYILPKQEDNPGAGYWGYPVATLKPGLGHGCGLAESVDGRAWDVLPPPQFDWGNVPPVDLEIGGVERIGGRCVMIGGWAQYVSDGYSMYTLIADDPRGPFRPDPDAYRLCGTSTRAAGWGVSFLAAWCRGKAGELLISNYVSVPSGTWMLPMRKAVFDDGHLRLGWWPANAALKGAPIALNLRQATVNGCTWLEPKCDLAKGVIVEGTIRGVARGAGAAAGFAFAEAHGGAMEIRLGIGAAGQRETHVGRRHPLTGFSIEDTTGRGCATVTGIGDGTTHAFRLLLRRDLFELYVDDLLVQTYAYRPAGGAVGLVAHQADAVFDELAACAMTL